MRIRLHTSNLTPKAAVEEVLNIKPAPLGKCSGARGCGSSADITIAYVVPPWWYYQRFVKCDYWVGFVNRDSRLPTYRDLLTDILLGPPIVTLLKRAERPMGF
jgi:hypothetical protein